MFSNIPEIRIVAIKIPKTPKTEVAFHKGLTSLMINKDEPTMSATAINAYTANKNIA